MYETKYNNKKYATRIKHQCERRAANAKNDSTPNYKSIARICDYLNMSVDALLNRPIPEPEPVSLSAAINTVAAAAHISSDALRAVLHLPINDK